MKKLSSIFSAIYSFFDKYFLAPLTRLIYKITVKSDASGRKFENFLSKQSTLLFLSLFLSIFIFIVVDQKLITFKTSSSPLS